MIGPREIALRSPMARWHRRWHVRRGHALGWQNVRNPNVTGVLHVVMTCSCGKAWVQ
jgi:hypothetical protein